MKPFKILLNVIRSGIICSIFLSFCTQHEPKSEDAFDRLKKEKLLTKDSVIITTEPIQEHKKNSTIKKIENLDEWAKFKLETENKIVANENKIKDLKGAPNFNSKLLKKIATIEKHNNELRKQMDVYHEDEKVLWANFRAKIIHDVNEIDIDLKDLMINNHK
ncbi:MAG: hypothetical protein WCR52_04770 [Bacteroidota bacterium]